MNNKYTFAKDIAQVWGVAVFSLFGGKLFKEQNYIAILILGFLSIGLCVYIMFENRNEPDKKSKLKK